MTSKLERKRQITIETHSITIIRINSKSNSAYCQRCQSNTATFSPEQLSEIFQTSLSEIYRQIESREFHLIADQDMVLICGKSFKSSNDE